MATTEVSFLRQRAYLAVAINHLLVDVMNSGRTLLVAIIAVSIGLTNAQVGIALLLYNVGSALSQPLFGWMADRIGPRWLVVGGTGWMILFYSIAAVAADWPALVALTVAGFGSGAFHPTGTMVASEASVARRTQATSVFFMAGQVGLFLGPVLTGFLLEQFGRPGYLVLPALALVAFVSAWQWLTNDRKDYTHSHTHAYAEDDDRNRTMNVAAVSSPPIVRPPGFTRRAILLSTIIVSVGTVSIAAINFAPKLFTELGYGADYVGILAGLWMLGSAGGGLLGGMLADRWNGRIVILLAAAASILPIYFYIPAEQGQALLLMMAGFFVGMPHSILILMAQSLLPGRRALASGLALGFMFFSGSVGSYVVGVIADQIGLATTLQYTAVLPLIAIGATLLLPREREVVAIHP